MSGHTIPPPPPLLGPRALFAAKAQKLNAASQPGGTNPRNALAGKCCSVGSGDNRATAQSAGSALQGLFASLSNGFMSVVHGAKSAYKSISSYVFGPSQPQGPLRPKEAMKKVSSVLGQGANTVTDSLNRNAATKEVYRSVRNGVNPRSSTLDALGRQANDALTDVKQAGKGLLDDAGQFLKKLF